MTIWSEVHDVGTGRFSCRLCAPLRRRRRVAFARTRTPPAADLDRTGGVAHVDDAVELVVEGVARLDVCGAARHVHEFAVDKPQCVDAARMRSWRIEMGNEPRPL